MGTKFMKDGEGWSFPADFGFTGSTSGNVNPRPHPTQDDGEFGDGTYLAKQSEVPVMAKGGKVPVQKAATAVLGALQVGKKIGQSLAPISAGMAPQAPTITQGPIPAAMMGAARPPGMATGGPVESGGIPPDPSTDDDYFHQPRITHPTPHPAPKDTGYAHGGKIQHYGGGDQRYDSDAEAAQAEAHSQTVPGEYPYPEPEGFAEGGKFIQSAISHPGRMKNLAKRHGVSVHQEMEHDKHSKSPSLRSAANLGLRLTGGDLKPHKGKR